MNNRRASLVSILRRLAVPVALVACAAGCEEPSQFLASYLPGGPQGVLEGTVTYIGPLPCTSNQHVVGAAVLEVFSTAALPPPQGLGTTAESLGTVGGDTLFGGVADQLTYNADGSEWCPAPGTSVTVSAPWTIAPLPGGVYEVRGFYDYAGTFDPVFSISKSPVAGDIGGGAITNAQEVLMGADPDYRQITLGVKQSDGTYQIPSEGSNIGGITVELALPLPLDPPVFYPSSVTYASYACSGNMVSMVTPKVTDYTQITQQGIVMPSDYQIPIFTLNPTQTAGSLITLDLKAGVLPTEVPVATQSPYDLPGSNATFTFSWDPSHPVSAANSILPSLYPLSIFSKLGESAVSGAEGDLTAQSAPVVIIQGLTIYKTLLDTVQWGTNPPANNAETTTDVFVGLPPAAVCIDPTDPTSPTTLVVTHDTDCEGNMILMNQPATVMVLEQQFGRPVTVVEGCLPQGVYAMNLVYGTSQAWSNPNEEGVCQPGEDESSDKNSCSVPNLANAERTLLHSQDLVLTIGAPTDSSWCTAHPTPPACCPNGKCP